MCLQIGQLFSFVCFRFTWSFSRIWVIGFGRKKTADKKTNDEKKKDEQKKKKDKKQKDEPDAARAQGGHKDDEDEDEEEDGHQQTEPESQPDTKASRSSRSRRQVIGDDVSKNVSDDFKTKKLSMDGMCTKSIALRNCQVMAKKSQQPKKLERRNERNMNRTDCFELIRSIF